MAFIRRSLAPSILCENVAKKGFGKMMKLNIDSRHDSAEPSMVRVIR